MSTPVPQPQPYPGLAYCRMSGPKEHLFVVVSDPLVVPLKGKRPCVVVVNFTSVKGTRFDDLTCVFTPKDYSYFKHDSYAFYQKADVEFTDSVMQNVSSAVWKQKADFTVADVAKIKIGLRNSPHTPVDIKNLPI